MRFNDLLAIAEVENRDVRRLQEALSNQELVMALIEALKRSVG